MQKKLVHKLNHIVVVSVEQVLTRRLRLRLQKSHTESGLIDRTGKTLKVEPLTTVAALERYLLKMVQDYCIGMILF